MRVEHDAISTCHSAMYALVPNVKIAEPGGTEPLRVEAVGRAAESDDQAELFPGNTDEGRVLLHRKIIRHRQAHEQAAGRPTCECELGAIGRKKPRADKPAEVVIAVVLAPVKAHDAHVGVVLVKLVWRSSACW